MSTAPAIIPSTVAPRDGEGNLYQFGKILDEPIEAYHACGAISKTKLDVFRDSPPLFQKRFITKQLPPQEKSEALIFGSAVDALALEGMEAFKKKFVLVPEDAPKRPTKAQRNAKKPSPAALESIAFWDRFGAEAEGKEILTDKQAALAQRCADALASNATFARFMQFGTSQVTFRIRGDKFALQCRPDRWIEEGCDLTDGAPCIVDLKTIVELPADRPDLLPRHIADFGYHRGAYLYPEIVSTVMKYPDGFRPPFILAFVEKREPHAVCVRVVDPQAIEVGEREVAESLTQLRRCLAEDRWPESWEEPMAEVSLPGYYVKRSNEAAPNNLWG